MYDKAWRVCIDVGPSNSWIGLWITVKPKRLGGTQIPHGVGGRICWHPCLFGSFLCVLRVPRSCLEYGMGVII